MTKEEVRKTLIKVLETIQTNSGLPCPNFTGFIRPAEDLEGFDSTVWPVAIGMLSAELSLEIPDDVNIFASKDGKQANSIDEAVELVCKLSAEPKEMAPAE
jgi:hypothetical protein